MSSELDEQGLYVQNIGMGPAIILDRSIHLNGRTFYLDQGVSFGQFSGLNEPWKLSDIQPGSSLAPGDRVMILGFNKEDMTPERRRLLFVQVFQKINVEIEFASFYEEKWKITSSMSATSNGGNRMSLKRVPYSP